MAFCGGCCICHWFSEQIQCLVLAYRSHSRHFDVRPTKSIWQTKFIFGLPDGLVADYTQSDLAIPKQLSGVSSPQTAAGNSVSACRPNRILENSAIVFSRGITRDLFGTGGITILQAISKIQGIFLDFRFYTFGISIFQSQRLLRHRPLSSLHCLWLRVFGKLASRRLEKMAQDRGRSNTDSNNDTH